MRLSALSATKIGGYSGCALALTRYSSRHSLPVANPRYRQITEIRPSMPMTMRLVFRLAYRLRRYRPLPRRRVLAWLGECDLDDLFPIPSPSLAHLRLELP